MGGFFKASHRRWPSGCAGAGRVQVGTSTGATEAITNASRSPGWRAWHLEWPHRDIVSTPAREGWARPDPAASPALTAFPVVDAGHRAVRQLCQPQGHRRQKPSRPQVIPCVSRPGSPQGQQPLLGRRPSADSRQGAGAFSKASPSSAEQPQTAAHDLGAGGPQAFLSPWDRVGLPPLLQWFPLLLVAGAWLFPQPCPCMLPLGSRTPSGVAVPGRPPARGPKARQVGAEGLLSHSGPGRLGVVPRHDRLTASCLTCGWQGRSLPAHVYTFSPSESLTFQHNFCSRKVL